MARHKRAAQEQGAWLVFEDESGQGLRPPKGRTWGRCGRTPVVTVTGGHNTRVSLAALIAVRAGQQARLVYRVHDGRWRPGDRRKGFTEAATPGSWMPRTSSSAGRLSWSGATLIPTSAGQ
ncbi:MAG: family transposase [Actinomycetia bacterium]|nr:family transposase [Actinomycetes bacterium]